MSHCSLVPFSLVIATLAFGGSFAPAAEPKSIADEIRDQMFDGPGGEVHLRQAAPTRFEAWKKAADAGDAAAQWVVGSCFSLGVEVKQDRQEAVKWYRKAAKQGHVGGQYRLANCYASGTGVNENLAEAVKWYQKAADQGDPTALCALAGMYESGTGVEADEDKAADLYEQAVAAYRKTAEAGFAGSQFILGRIFTHGGYRVEADPAEGMKWYKKSADRGYAWSQTNLAHAYLFGTNGTKVDVDEAKRLFVLAAGQGDTLADYHLAGMYLDDLIPGKDGADAQQLYKRVLNAYREAADREDSEARYFLGTMYERGYGVPVDEEEALGWYRKAAELGCRRSQFNVAWYYESGKGGLDVDYKQAAEWYQLASDNDSAKASRRLAEMYDAGLGVKQDRVKAEELRAKAKTQADD